MLFKKKTPIVKVEKFIAKENSIENKLNVLNSTINVNKFYNTLKLLKLSSSEKGKYEKQFIDRCFQNIDFKNEKELKDLFLKLKLYINDMEVDTVEYCNKLFKYCMKNYLDKSN